MGGVSEEVQGADWQTLVTLRHYAGTPEGALLSLTRS